MWNHNIHHHRYLLSKLPDKLGHVLDVGCGLGLFASELAKRSELVDAIDVDNDVLAVASTRHKASNINYHLADLLEADLPIGSYDAIIAIASVHHMELEAALDKMKSLLKPSGQLLILGLYREATMLDYIYSVISIPLNLIYSNQTAKTSAMSNKVPPTRQAQLTLNQIKAIFNDKIPGGTVKRHLFWRYSLIWQKP